MRNILNIINQHDPHKVALVGDNKTFTYAALIREVDDKVELLKECRVLGIALENGPEWVVWDLAAIKANVVCVPIPSFFTKEQTDNIVKKAGVSHIISSKGLNETGVDASDKILEGTSKVTFTSGSTGDPKGVCLSQRSLEEVAESIISVIGEDCIERHLSILPLSVLLENVAGVYSALLTGSPCHIYSPERTGINGGFMPDFRRMLKTIRDNKIVSVILVPELLNGLIKALSQTKMTLPDLKFLAVGGSKVAPELIEKARDAGLPVYEGYGLSECGSVVSLNTPHCEDAHTAGKLLPHQNVKIENNEIVITKPAFLGYLGEPQKGDYYTGDIGEVDEKGFVRISGRKKNILITSYGRNVSPEWVESKLLSQSEIMQAFVYGDAMPHIGALIVPTSVNVNIKMVMDRVNQMLPEYARVKVFHAIAPFSSIEGTLSGVGRLKRDVILKKYNDLIMGEENIGFSKQLEHETAIYRATLYNVPQVVDALRGKISRESYVAFLAETYHYVKKTVPLLKKMKEFLAEDKKWIVPYIDQYIEEETGEENWILENIEAMGGDKKAVEEASPNEATEIFNAYNEDYIVNKNALGFLGVLFMLENASKKLAAQGSKALKESLGASDEGFTYLDSHTFEDRGDLQSEFLEETLEKIYDPDDQRAIIDAAQNTFLLFSDILRSIPHQKKKK